MTTVEGARNGAGGRRNCERTGYGTVISYDGPETFAERNAHYWASPKRERMGLAPKDCLLETDVREGDTAL